MSSTYVIKKSKRFFGLLDKWEFIVASRRLYVGEDNSVYRQMARKYNIKNKLIEFYYYLIRNGYRPSDINAVGIQGEICGPKIQGNRLGLKNNNLYIFNICVSTTDGKQQKIDPYSPIIQGGIVLHSIFDKMDFVNKVYDNYTLPNTIDELIEDTKGNYEIFGKPREGLVFRNYYKEISFKAINPEYLVKNNL